MLPRRISGKGRRGPLACVIGTMDLVRPLGLAGIRCAVVAEQRNPARYSRFTDAAIEWAHPLTGREVLLDRLMQFAASQPERPVLYYEGDWDLLLVSRNRHLLEQGYRFVIPDSDLVEDVVDKARFQHMVERLELPVPASRRLSSADPDPAGVDLPYPLILKPLTRRTAVWKPVAGSAKALRVDTPAQLEAVWGRLREAEIDVVAQELLPGPETLIESYHAYVDESGQVVGEFTGRKLRTLPARYGESTALEITDRSDVATLGRELVARIGLRGVMKLDFKRDPAGRLRLLEINPRFNLWHHPGAVAGVNLPALVYRDLVGLPGVRAKRARAGVRWCYHKHDARAAQAQGISRLRWLGWALRCQAKSAVSLDDPMPVIHGLLPERLQRLAARSTKRGRWDSAGRRA